MQEFLFLIVFLLNIITITAVYFLFKQIQVLKGENSNKFTEMAETFLQEIRTENEQLQKSVLKHPSKKGHLANNTLFPHTPVKQKTRNTNTTNQTSIIDDFELNSMSDHFETSLQANVLNLHNQGIPTEEIARQLNCGKTEAALIIKLHEQNNV